MMRTHRAYVSNRVGEIASLKNLGPKSAERLCAVGITSEDRLREVGVVATYSLVKQHFPNDTSLNLLWALQGAIMDIHWLQIPDDIKTELLSQIKDA